MLIQKQEEIFDEKSGIIYEIIREQGLNESIIINEGYQKAILNSI